MKDKPTSVSAQSPAQHPAQIPPQDPDQKRAGADLQPETLDVRRNRLRWRSRRGMLELELLLQPFVSSRLAALETGPLAVFERLLECEDWDIFNWLQERETAPAEFSDILAQVRHTQAQSNQPSAGAGHPSA